MPTLPLTYNLAVPGLLALIATPCADSSIYKALSKEGVLNSMSSLLPVVEVVWIVKAPDPATLKRV